MARQKRDSTARCNAANADKSTRLIGVAGRVEAKIERRERCASGARMQGTDLGQAATGDLRQDDRIEISEIGAV